MNAAAVRPGDLFVFYGLLKQGAAGGPEHIPLAAAGDWLAPCQFRGCMFDLGSYPGVTGGNGICHGMLYRIRDISVVAALDAYEDLTEDAATSLYVRRKIELLDQTGSLTGARGWIYQYNQDTDGYAIIADGSWPLERGGQIT